MKAAEVLAGIIYQFEELALKLYQEFLPTVPIEKKIDLLRLFKAEKWNLHAVAQTPLQTTMENLLKKAQSANPWAVIVRQGLVLETLAISLYPLLKNSRELSEAGITASQAINASIEKKMRDLAAADNIDIFKNFCQESSPILLPMAELGEAVDRFFGKDFGVTFGDLMGEFTAQLIGRCTELGMERRKVLCHLTETLMANP